MSWQTDHTACQPQAGLGTGLFLVPSSFRSTNMNHFNSLLSQIGTNVGSHPFLAVLVALLVIAALGTLAFYAVVWYYVRRGLKAYRRSLSRPFVEERRVTRKE